MTEERVKWSLEFIPETSSTINCEQM